MRVAHEYQKKSAQRWMSCGTETKLPLVNPKRSEEFDEGEGDEYLPRDDDVEDNYFEFEVPASHANVVRYESAIVTLIPIVIAWRLTH